MAKVINIWWVLLLVGLFQTGLFGQSTASQLKARISATSNPSELASLNYKLAEIYLNRTPQLTVRYAQNAYRYAQQVQNTSLQSGSALLMGKAFIAQNDFDNANLWLKRGINAGKSIKSVPLVIEGNTLLASVSIRQNDHKQAYDQLLAGLNYYYLYPNSKSNNTSNTAELKKLRKQVADLKAKEKELQTLLSAANDINDDLRANPEIETVYVDSSLYRQDDIDTGTLDNETPIIIEKESTFMGLPSKWWILGLSILSLGLLSGLFWQWNKLMSAAELNDSDEYELRLKQVQEKATLDQSNWEKERREKEHLIADYEEELKSLKGKTSLAASLFTGGEAALKRQTSVMLVDIGLSDQASKAMGSPEKIQQLEKELRLLIDEHPEVQFINKIGPTMLFVANPNNLKKASQELIEFGKELKEYFEDRSSVGWNAKIAVHSGPLVFAKSADMPQGVDIWGEELDRSSWLLAQSKPGELTISAEARDLIDEPEGWTYLGEHRDFSGNETRIFKKT